MSSDNAPPAAAASPAPGSEAHQPQPFKVARGMIALLLSGGICTVLASLSAQRFFEIDADASNHAAALIGTVVVLGSVISLRLIARSATRGPQAIANSFMLGILIRMVTALAAVAVGIAMMKLPVPALLLTLGLTYLPLLAVEVALITRYLRQFGATPDCRNSKPATGAGPEVLA